MRTPSFKIFGRLLTVGSQQNGLKLNLYFLRLLLRLRDGSKMRIVRFKMYGVAFLGGFPEDGVR